jgi:uncharacterized phage protein gp47/JayE
MRQSLAVSEPDLDTTVGTVPRKMLDAWGESLEEASTDAFLVSYVYDLDARSGESLDDLVRLFVFSRLPAKRAFGEITFERQRALDTLVIPIGTQVSTDDTPPIVTATMVTTVLGVGDNITTVPAMAVNPGSSGNIEAQTLRRGVTQITGTVTFTNLVAFSGGTDAESDAHLRGRVRRTIFRNLAGTEAMYLGVAIEHPDAVQANVVGAMKRHREQIELVSGNAVSTIENAAHIYGPEHAFFGESLDDGEVLIEGVHYTFNDSVNPPEIDSLSASLVPDGIYELEYGYSPLASRNDPSAGITNRVDLWVWGVRVVEHTEVLILDRDRVFNTTSDDPLNRTLFERRDEANPTSGNIYIPLGFRPVADAADSIVIDGVTYLEDTHYWVVNRVDAFGLASRSASGLEFLADCSPLADPPDGESFSVTYGANAVPREIETTIQGWRIVNEDVWVHQAKPIFLKLHFAAILAIGVDQAQVASQMRGLLNDLFSRVGFGGRLQVSDIHAVASSVPGVDAIRFLTSDDDATDYALQRLNAEGTVMETFSSDGRAIDVVTDDDSVPVLDSIRLVPKAPNTLNSLA